MREFVRYTGYEDPEKFRGMIIKKYAQAMKNGVFFKEKLPAAGMDEISKAAGYTAASFDSAKDIQKSVELWLKDTNAPFDAEKIAQVMAAAVADCGENKKANFFEFFCNMMKYLEKRPDNVLYIGAAGLKDLYFLLMAQAAGAEVTLVSRGMDADFEKLKFKDRIIVKDGSEKAPIQIDFENLDLSKETAAAEMREEGERASALVKRLSTTAAGFFEDVLKDRKTRVINGGGVFTPDGEIPVYCAALIGFDADEVYTNMLVKFKESFAGLKKQLIFIEKPLSAPTADEMKLLGAASRTSTQAMLASMAEQIELQGDRTRTALAQKALRDVLGALETPNQTVIYNYAVKLVTWLYRCTQARRYAVRYEDIPVVLYYGDISPAEVLFLRFMSLCGFDAVYITPNKANSQTVGDKNEGGRIQIFELPQSRESGEYPKTAAKMKTATVAYDAERELDVMLYNDDTGIYRDFQFPNSQSMTLKTTYEEINILWKQQARFRPGFSTAGNLVTVPNIFAKISGVEDENLKAYWDDVEKKLTPDTVLIVKAPNRQTEEADLSVYRQFYRNGRIDAKKLKDSTLNKYGYLPDRIQDMLFFKLQEECECGFIKLEGDELMCSVLHYGMNLGREFLQLIQQFDFTKNIPKLVYIDAVEDSFTKEECIKTVLCSLIGFDVVIYTPSGYKNIETFVSANAFEEHIRNRFMYSVNVPKMKIPETDAKPGFFGRLFGKK